MLISRSTQIVERKGGALIKSRVDYTPERQTERREVHTPGQVVVVTALMEEGFLSLSKQIITPLQVVTITHKEENYGSRVTDETTVESTPLADLVRDLGVVGIVSAEQDSNPRFKVYPPAPEQEEFYGMEDEGDHDCGDDCGGDCCSYKWN